MHGLNFADHWNAPDVRGALVAMQGWVCAYCQCEIDPRDGGDVDHFRPKQGSEQAGHDGYWWLAYRFRNYLLSCRRCNEVVKRDRFPVQGSTRAGQTDADPDAHEQRLPVDPARDPVDDRLRVDMKDDRCSVGPSSTNGPEDLMAKRIKETAVFFGLNEDIDLIRRRVRVRTEAVRADRSTPGKETELRKRAATRHPWSATWREALLTYAPDVQLPSLAEELRWLLDDLLERINVAIDVVKAGRARDSQQRRFEEIKWTLAVLWFDPPTGNPDDVGQWLVENKLKPWVEPLLAQFA